MKKLAIFAFAAVALVAASCGSKTTTENEATAEVATISVDSVLVNPDALVGDTITIEGVCSHLCKHGGTKAFILGTNENTMLRCNATEEMGGRFPAECIHKALTVTGVLCEERISEETVCQLEAQRAAQIEAMADQATEEDINNPGGCETERKAAGQADVATFEERMADYRARIAAREAAEGKAYLSTYYLVATTYTILPE